MLAFVWPAQVGAQADPTWRSWNQPVEPYRIIGNVYYVGASDITSFLIATPQGHVILDGGFEETVPIISAGVKKLGFKLEDVKFLLNSQSHFDHAAGLAALKQMTGAKLVATEADAAQIAAGGRGDFRFGDQFTYPAAKAERIIRDGEQVTLGGVTLTARITPGHTKGCTTWTMKVTEGGKPYDVVFAGSGTINPGVVLLDNPNYPRIAEDYALTFRVLKSLPCDVFLSSHASFFAMADKVRRLKAGAATNPFIDPQGYRDYVANLEGKYVKQLQQERRAKGGR